MKQRITVIYDAQLGRYYFDGLEMDLNDWLQFKKEHQDADIVVLTFNRPPMETIRASEIAKHEE
jgi:hypothetical protein